MEVVSAAESLLSIQNSFSSSQEDLNPESKRQHHNHSHNDQHSDTHIPKQTVDKQKTKTTTPSGDNQSDTQTKSPPYYDNSLKSNCTIFIQRDPKSPDAKKDLNNMSIGRILHSTFPGKIVDINRSGFGKVRVVLNSGKAANQLLKDKSLSTKGLIAIVPANFVSCQGVMSNVPVDITIDEILANTEIVGPHVRDIKIINARRMNRKTLDEKDNSVKYVPTTTVLLTFSGTILSQRVAIYKGSSQIRPYIPDPRMCSKCSRFGHIAIFCRSKPRCQSCTLEVIHDINNICTGPKGTPECLNCHGKHMSSSKECPEFIFQKKVRAYATIHKTSFNEAKSILRPSNHQTSKQAFNFSDFPELGEAPTPTFSTSQNASRYLFSEATNVTSHHSRSSKNASLSLHQKPTQSRKRSVNNSFYATHWNNGRSDNIFSNGSALSAPSPSDFSSSSTTLSPPNVDPLSTFLTWLNNQVAQISSTSSPDIVKQKQDKLSEIIESLRSLFDSGPSVNGQSK
ncbi:uncharacterized protein LOC122501853 [Leptopilina heterotoma]|uniref:uncharacterized protein LOC122501853 n=1 Tax=Leptopilina heterotoma TaxID=63436 RepID=UPI001CA83E3A|nr:uncharacterized protein LOC122501853 [Leptopilina heterotoma]